MTEQEFTEIYNDLLQLTRAKKIQWKTQEEGFSVAFSRSSVNLGLDNDYRVPNLRIYNDDGLMIAASALPVGDDYADRVRRFSLDPSELYELVESQIFKYSETTRNILDELRQLRAS